MGKKFAVKLAAALTLTMGAVATPAMGQSAGSWSLGASVGWVIPKANNGSIAGGALRTDIGNDIKPTFTVEYFVLDNLGIQLLGAVPFAQTVRINGEHVGNVQHLPPALYLQYHFRGLLGLLSPSLAYITPFAGVGVEHSFIYDEDFNAPFSGVHVRDSTSYTFHGGLDFTVKKNQAVRFDIYYINIDSKIRAGTTTIGTTHIDPLVWNVGYVWTF
ncbi:MAG: OmpW family protein [Nevskiaceae bacterium]|nr:MAG: OmpW family protein [Nevskiaceae bacterium]TBR73140.1 MAG: OmpW family protein [Nevskiaceae bacterium]